MALMNLLRDIPNKVVQMMMDKGYTRVLTEEDRIKMAEDVKAFTEEMFGEKAVKGGGVGLDNVRQRLRLCYGPEADLVIASSAAGATVSFAVPFPL